MSDDKGMSRKNQKVGVYLEIQNSERNKLGMPLPKGIVRVYKADKSGAKQFIGGTAEQRARDKPGPHHHRGSAKLLHSFTFVPGPDREANISGLVENLPCAAGQGRLQV